MNILSSVLKDAPLWRFTVSAIIHSFVMVFVMFGYFAIYFLLKSNKLLSVLSLFGGIMGAIIALFFGSFIAYKGGLADTVLGILCDIFMAFPLIVIAISLVNIVDGGMLSIVISLSVSTITWFLRMIRSYTKTECDKNYIECSKISGASDLRIVLTHIIPNVLPQYIVYVTTNIAAVIIGIIECVPFTGDVSVLQSEYSQILLSASELI